eukprot:TRINITY_DN1310_c0_g1_i2.p1 TRINITY_DN1310_c0_g1~~TRINITY_DN1310_c0_g1_i2.p1  ORF type:complete len:142 (-),score=10.90 TRINITY_DN1310_c0_g1_i2:951-1376(-)
MKCENHRRKRHYLDHNLVYKYQTALNTQDVKNLHLAERMENTQHLPSKNILLDRYPLPLPKQAYKTDSTRESSLDHESTPLNAAKANQDTSPSKPQLSGAHAQSVSNQYQDHSDHTPHLTINAEHIKEPSIRNASQIDIFR